MLPGQVLGRVSGRGRPVQRAHIGLIPMDWALVKEIEHEHQHPGQQNQELHRNLDDAVPEHAPFGFGGVLPAQIPLDLALVGAEVGQLEEEAANQSAPQGVAGLRVPRQIDGLEFSEGAGEPEALAEGHDVAQVVHGQSKGGKEAGEHHRHLLFVGHPDGAGAARGGVQGDQDSDENAGPGERPAEDFAQNDARPVDRDPGTEPPLDQKQDGGERAGPLVEAPANEFIGGEDLPFVIERDEDEAHHQHGERQSEIELHEPHPVQVALAGRAEKSDRTGLGGHDAEADGPPPGVVPAPKIRLRGVGLAGLPDAIGDDEAEAAEKDQPVEPMHGSQ